LKLILYRVDCGRSLANDESVWTPGENVGKSIEFSLTCWLVKHGKDWLLWDTGVPESAYNDPKGWSTLPKLIVDVVHLESNFERSIVPSLNTSNAGSLASMEKVGKLMATYKATLFINHDKPQTQQLKVLPAHYD
jgi:hypothetical protein